MMAVRTIPVPVSHAADRLYSVDTYTVLLTVLLPTLVINASLPCQVKCEATCTRVKTNNATPRCAWKVELFQNHGQMRVHANIVILVRKAKHVAIKIENPDPLATAIAAGSFGGASPRALHWKYLPTKQPPKISQVIRKGW